MVFCRRWTYFGPKSWMLCSKRGGFAEGEKEESRRKALIPRLSQGGESRELKAFESPCCGLSSHTTNNLVPLVLGV